MQEALNRLFNLKQKGRSYSDYFEEAREIERELPKEIASTIPTRLVQGLDDKTLRMMAGAIMGQAPGQTPSLEVIIRIVKGALGDSDKENEHSVEQIKYRNMKPIDQALTNALEANSRVMSGALENNAKMMKSMINKFMAFGRNNGQNRQNQGQPPNQSANSGRNAYNQGDNYQHNTRDQSTSRNNTSTQVHAPAEAWPNNNTRQRSNTSTGVRGAFRKSQVECFRCGKTGHFSNECENPEAPWEVRQEVRQRTTNKMAAISEANNPSSFTPYPSSSAPSTNGASKPQPLGEKTGGNLTAGAHAVIGNVSCMDEETPIDSPVGKRRRMNSLFKDSSPERKQRRRPKE